MDFNGVHWFGGLFSDLIEVTVPNEDYLGGAGWGFPCVFILAMVVQVWAFRPGLPGRRGAERGGRFW